MSIDNPGPERINSSSERVFEHISQVWQPDHFRTVEIIRGHSGNIALGTDVGGRYGEPNQDCVALDTTKDLFVVADGIGGYAGGREAAATVCQAALKLDINSLKKSAVAHEFHRDVSHGLRQLGINEGGACYVLGKIEGKKLIFWNAGDVEIIQLNGNGDMRNTLANTKNLNLRNAPTGDNPGAPALNQWTLQPGDRFYIFSDGLRNSVSNRNIETEIQAVHQQPINEALDRLLSGAISRMKAAVKEDKPSGKVGRKIKMDNVSLFIYEITPSK